MELRQHKSSNFLKRPIVKSHSCYCEAKGPIVKEGFVAARIRAIQGDYNPMSVSAWSHSPMIPCLMYQRSEEHECYSLSKRQSPAEALRSPSIQLAGNLADPVIKPFPEGILGHGCLNEPGHFSSGGDIGAKTESARDPISEYSKSEQLIHQVSQQGSNNGMKDQTEEDVLDYTPMTLTKQPITPEHNQLLQLEGAAKDMGHDNVLGRKSDEKNQPVQLPEASFAEELVDMLHHASQGHNTANEGYSTTHTSSSNLSDLDAETNNSQGQAPYLKSSPTSDFSLRLLIKKSFASFLPTTDEGSTSLEESSRPKKHSVRRKTKEQVIHDDRTGDSLMIEPRDTGQFVSRSRASPKHAQRASSLQPLARASSDIPEPIELRSLSTKPMTSCSHHQDDSVFSSHNCANQSSGRAKPQDSITLIKSPRRSISHSPSLHQFVSGASQKFPSVLSGTPSPPARRNWSWWKLLLADTQSDAREILDEGPNRSVSDKVEPDDTWPPPKGSDVEFFQTRPAQEAETIPAVSALKKDDHEINLTAPGDRTSSVNKSNRRQRLPEPCTFLSSPSAELDPAPSRQPKPQRPQHHVFDWATNFPLEPLSQDSSGAASPVRLPAMSSTGSSKRGNRGQKIKRVQVIVTLDGSSDVMVEATMKRMRKS